MDERKGMGEYYSISYTFMKSRLHYIYTVNLEIKTIHFYIKTLKNNDCVIIP